jgi:phenylacetate-CoA ligase
MTNYPKYYLKKFIRKGWNFKKILKELDKSQYYSQRELTELQNKKLQKLIHHCYHNVPFYTDLFTRLNLTPDDINGKEDLTKLPFIDKYTVRENFDKFVSKNSSKMFRTVSHTSGSSGTPGKFLRDYHSINFENAALWRLWKNAGDTGLKRVTLRGDIIVAVSKTKPPFWEYNPANKELLMSSYHLSESNAQSYINKILKFNPGILYAYPSTAYILAKYFKDRNQSITLKAVFTSSEPLSLLQKEYIEEVFNCKVYDWYGQAERVVGIGYCEKGTYHIMEDYSIVELIATDTGLEPVGTHLHNFVMPLLRYKTGDIIKLSERECSCGRHFREVEQIQGRNIDYILTPEGSKITIFNHIPRGVDNLIETQFVQEIKGELIINAAVNERFNESDEAKLLRNTIEHTSKDMKVKINKVSQIPRGPNGKFLGVINKLK